MESNLTTFEKAKLSGGYKVEEKPRIDLTRLNRHERRSIGKQNGMKIPGRNLPFVKKYHGSVESFYAKRAEEIASETKSLETNDSKTN